MKILVTGANGFIGTAVSRNLGGHKVCLTSRQQPANIQSDFFKKTISSITDFSDCLAKVDVVIHTASLAHQVNNESEDLSLEFMETNYRGTLNLARQAVTAGVKRFIFISSAKVNGEKSEPGIPFCFDDTPSPKGAYAISKAHAEEGLLEIGRSSNLEIVIIRPPLVYGAGVKANFQSLIKLSKLNLPLPLGGLRNKRSFVSVENLVDLITICIDHPNAAGQTFLISDDSDVSTTELLTIIYKAFGYKAKFLNISPKILKFFMKFIGKKDVIDRLCDDFQVDIKHTKAVLGWKPNVSMGYSINRCVQYFKTVN